MITKEQYEEAKRIVLEYEKQNNNLEKKLLKFRDELYPYLTIYGKEILNQFYKYWSEPNKSKTKLRYELEKTWDLSRRLERWASNNFKPIKTIEHEQPHVPTADKAAIAAKYGKPNATS